MSSRKMPPSPCAAGKPGRPRCEKAHQAILAAANELLAETGYEHISIEGIAARAGVGKTTIYRNWPTKAALIMEAFFVETSPKIPFKPASSVEETIRKQMHKVIRLLLSPRGRVVANLFGGSHADEELRTAFCTQWIAVMRAELIPYVQQGIDEGIFTAEDPNLIIDMLYAPLYFNLLTRFSPLTKSYADRLIDLAMNGIRRSAPPASTSNGGPILRKM